MFPLPNLRLLLTAALLIVNLAVAAPEKWTADIDKFTHADALTPPPRGAVVFVGASSIRRWTTLATDFPGVPVINRGFGGSELTDSVFYADRIILPYAPRVVVIYAGENDLQAGKSPESVLSDFQKISAMIHTTLPKTRILFLAIKESPSRAKIRENVLRANALLAAECAKHPHRIFVDVATPMLDASGKTRPELFIEDQLHLQPAGYAVWTKVLTPFLIP